MNKERQRQELTAEACEWAALTALNEVGESERSDFRAWLDKSPQHAAAYQEACMAFDHPVVAAATAQAAQDVSSNENRVPDQASPSVTRLLISRARAIRPWVATGALAATALIAVWSLPLLQTTPTAPYTNQIATAEYTTTGTDIREVRLPDGSFVTLGARSALNVSFTADERHLTLLEGEVYFAVASDKSRPFIVNAGSTSVRAVGTEFDVRLAADSVRVDVTEGKIKVRSPATAVNASGSPTTTMLANAGERLLFEPENGLTKRPPAPDAEPAVWRTGRLQYFNEELRVVVADANRYYDGNIRIVSDEINAMRVSALFSISNIEHIFDVLAQQVPISVSTNEQGDIILSANQS